MDSINETDKALLLPRQSNLQCTAKIPGNEPDLFFRGEELEVCLGVTKCSGDEGFCAAIV